MRIELTPTGWRPAILSVILQMQNMHLTRLELATNGLKVRCSTTELQVQNPALIEGKHMNTNNWEVVFVLGLSSRGENRTHGNSFIRTAPSPLGYSRIVGRYECHLIPTLYRLVSQTWKGIWELASHGIEPWISLLIETVLPLHHMPGWNYKTEDIKI